MTVIEQTDKNVQKMNTKKVIVPDRRVTRTKKALTGALIELILEKSYEKVTIQDIIDKANIGRSTFYIHYESKEQLLLDGHNNLNIGIFIVVEGNELSFLKLFEHVAQNLELAKAMLGKRSGHLLTGFFKTNISDKIRKNFNARFSKGKLEQKQLAYLSEATASAVISLLVCWIADDMPFSTQTMSTRCSELVNAVFKS
jgi:hypothetical protein